jgi:23S rRNA (uracil1939-C5)-methyltransferase
MTRRVLEVEGSALGSGGDGVAQTGEGRVFIPYAAPGDTLRVRLPEKPSSPLRAENVEHLTDGPDRQEPLCAHFTTCGGCAVQHVTESAYLAWKQSLVGEALSQRGIDPAVVAPMVPGGIGRRRRTRLHARSTERGVVLGYLGARSHRIVAVSECPVLVSSMVAFLEPLRTLLADLLNRGQEAEIAITQCGTGLDVTLAMGRSLQLAEREKLVSFADAHDLARLSWQPLQRGKPGALETVIRRRPPTIAYDGIHVEIPPDGFVQPTAEGETVLREAVLAAVAGSGRVVDLYAGCGAFSLPAAAAGVHVRAVDSAPDQIAALESAARQARLGEFVTTDIRDLNRRPLMGSELAAFDAVILDPPRAGAMAQAGSLAASSVPSVIYVSCNPASFARDARIMIDGGYELQSVTPVDQFLFSPHLELVAIFRAPAAGPGKKG